MANLNSVLNEHIRKLARREIKSQITAMKKVTTRYRRDIAALRREMTAMGGRTAASSAEPRRGPGRPRKDQSLAPRVATPKSGDAQGNRFRADGLKSHRSKLNLSAKDYGTLVGVSALTIYSWEAGKSKPRQAQLTKLVAVRGMGKREAMKRLEEQAPVEQAAPQAVGATEATQAN